MSTYEQMTSQKNRRCRPETLMRLLLSTSYPQSTLSDLALAITYHGGERDDAAFEQLAEGMREAEKSYTLFDFVRCIEIKRTFNTVKITTKCLDIDPSMRTINDCVATHQEMAVANIELVNGDIALEDVDQLAMRLMELFYRSQVKSKRPGDSIERTEWRYRTKDSNRNQPSKDPVQVETVLDVKQAIHRLCTSLRKKSFHIVLTQNCILLLDQKARLYGVNKK